MKIKFIEINPTERDCDQEHCDHYNNKYESCNNCICRPQKGYELLKIENIVKIFITKPHKLEIQIDYYHPKNNSFYTYIEKFETVSQCFNRYNIMKSILTK